MRHLIVLCAILVGVSYSSTSENNGTYGENADGRGLINLGRKLHKPMLTLIGMAIQNLHVHPCGEWTPWSSCDASRRGYFGSQTRTRSCTNTDHSDAKTMTTEADNKICEGFCPVSYNLTNNGFCLKLNTTEVSSDEAVKQCQLDGGFLIHIDSQQKRDDVKSMLSAFALHVHIDGRRKDATSPWEYKYKKAHELFKLTNNGFCLKLNTTNVSSDEAEKQCPLDGDYLIYIDSQQNHDNAKSDLH